MILREYAYHNRFSVWGFVILFFFSAVQEGVGFTTQNELDLNCSQLCTCNERGIETIMRQHRNRHVAHLGEKLRPELRNGPNSEYMNFLGMAITLLGKMVDITCVIPDDKTHKLSSLLNGIENRRYTALEVKCHMQGKLIWDVPSWQVAFNIFVSENCKLIPLDDERGIVVPMNMWILEIDNGGKNLFEILDIKYIMNTVAFSITESKTSDIPITWDGKYMLSADYVSLRSNKLHEMKCQVLFTKPLDTLNLGNNLLTSFPECLLNSNYIRLVFLSLTRNMISDLTPLYEEQENRDVPDIKIIDLSFNDIKNIEIFRNLECLLALDLSHNLLKEIGDECFVGLTNLEQIDLSYNRIYSLGMRAFTMNKHLRRIDLSHNAIIEVYTSQFPSKYSQLALDLRRNKLEYPPFQNCADNRLLKLNAKVHAAANPYFCDCYMIEFEMCTRWLQTVEGNHTQVESVFVDVQEFRCMSPESTKGEAVTKLPFTTTCAIMENCPDTCSCTLLEMERLEVNCSDRRLLEMPDIIPMRHNTSLVLFLDHNPLQMLSFRSYLHALSELHLDNCLLSSVTPAAISALQNVRVLTLHNNILQKLPSSTRNITLNNANNVTLHNNRWSCSCESLWLPRWITKHRSVLWTPGNIVCNYLRKPVEDFTEMDVNCSSSSYIEVILALCLALSSVVSTLVIAFYYRTEINLLLYAKLGLRFGSNFSYGDALNPYDAFVSYSQDNYRWIVDTLVPRLENGPGAYRLCLHYRDFPTGESVVDNIPWAIRLSRCSILVLSQDFMKKEWCIQELRAAFQRLLLVANRLIVIATDDVNVQDLSPDLRAYMHTHDYLRVGEPCFWEKLEMFMPPPSRFANMGQVSQAVKKGASGDQKDKPEHEPSDPHDQDMEPTQDIAGDSSMLHHGLEKWRWE